MNVIVAMNHHGHGFGPGEWGWLIAAGVVVLLIAAFVYWRTRQSDGLSPAERRELDLADAEILAMLRQTGKPLSQAELADILAMDIDDIAETLQKLEARHLIRRRWSSELRAYIITPA